MLGLTFRPVICFAAEIFYRQIEKCMAIDYPYMSIKSRKMLRTVEIVKKERNGIDILGSMIVTWVLRVITEWYCGFQAISIINNHNQNGKLYQRLNLPPWNYYISLWEQLLFLIFKFVTLPDIISLDSHSWRLLRTKLTSSASKWSLEGEEVCFESNLATM